MSEPKWTPAQRAAIEDRGGALLWPSLWAWPLWAPF